MANIKKLEKFIKSVNIAKHLDEEKLNEIGDRVVSDFQLDQDSCDDWRKQNERALKLAKQVKEEKSFPWPGAANVKYPLITTGAIQFASRAYPEIVKDNMGIVKAKIVGKDDDGMKRARADRVSAFMSYQFSEEICDWEEDTDRLLHILPVIGCLFRKSFYNYLERRNDSVFLLPDECVVNYKTKNMKQCRRISHVLCFYENDIWERKRDGLWLDADLGRGQGENEPDDDLPHEFIEQHRYIDLDDDGYAEPYIVTVHKERKKVVRILARYDEKLVELNDKDEVVRIKPHEYFVKYGFIPSPDGGFLDIGFGSLLEPINESVNTCINELLDAGAVHNAGGGFIGKGVNIKGGRMNFEPFEWKVIDSYGQDLRQNIFPLPTREPSQVLYLLTTLLIDAGKDISSVKNVLMGEKPGENVSNELFVSMVDQGLKVFSGIYKRVYRSLRKEFKLHYKLNARYLDEKRAYYVLDDEAFALKKDFNYRDCDVVPVADPNMALDAQRIARAMALKDNIMLPGIDPMGVTERWLDALNIDKEGIFNPNAPQKPDPKAEKIYLEMGIIRAKADLEKQNLFADILEKLARTKEIYTKSLLNVAKAESEEAGPQIEQYKTFVQELGVMVKQQEQEYRRLMNEREAESARTEGMAGGQNNPQGVAQTSG